MARTAVFFVLVRFLVATDIMCAALVEIALLLMVRHASNSSQTAPTRKKEERSAARRHFRVDRLAEVESVRRGIEPEGRTIAGF